MTAVHQDAEGEFLPRGDIEVVTVSADALRAGIRVVGELVPANATVLISIVRTHLAAGRRYLRVDLLDAEVSDPDVVASLREAHRAVTALGGMLVFENAGPTVLEASLDDTLFVRPPV